MDIETVIAEAQQAEGKATEVAAPVEAPQEPISKEEPAPEDVKAPKPDAELTPEQLAKREANRQSHRNSREAKLKRELRELKEWRQSIEPILQTVKPQNPQNQAPRPPDENQFTDWDTYLAAERKYYAELARYEARQEISERETQNTKQTEAQAYNAQIAAKVHAIGLKTQEFGKANPEYFELVSEHEGFLENMPPHVEQALLEAENQQLALYTLMKEGNLEALEDMTPLQVIREIAKAEIRGEQYLNQKKTTNAPAPMQAARGTGNPSKALHEMSVEDLLKRFN